MYVVSNRKSTPSKEYIIFSRKSRNVNRIIECARKSNRVVISQKRRENKRKKTE